MDLSGEDEARQACERQPNFMLECSKISGATFMREVTKKDIPDLTREGYLYKSNVECPIRGTNYFVLDRHCAYLIGVFRWKTSNGGRFVRPCFQEFEEIREGICGGKIIHEFKGVGGFGYDPLFIPDGYRQTFAEIDPVIKNAISHRGKSLLEIKETLDKYFR